MVKSVIYYRNVSKNCVVYPHSCTNLARLPGSELPLHMDDAAAAAPAPGPEPSAAVAKVTATPIIKPIVVSAGRVKVKVNCEFRCWLLAGCLFAVATVLCTRTDVSYTIVIPVLCAAVRFVASWKWDIPDEDVCGICHSEFERCCPSCKVPGDDCPPMWGACNHAFHMHCIMRWLESPRTGDAECPMCRRPWEFRAE